MSRHPHALRDEVPGERAGGDEHQGDVRCGEDQLLRLLFVFFGAFFGNHTHSSLAMRLVAYIAFCVLIGVNIYLPLVFLLFTLL